MFSTAPLYYNTVLFQEAGQAPPDATWTWQQAVAVAQKLTKTGATSADSTYGLNLTQYGESILFSYGWTYTNADYSQCMLETDANAQGMQFWQDLIYKYKVAPAPGSDFGKGAPFGVFSTIRLAMETQGSYQIGS
ncbi:MAG TPA: extracellular solute-binding protein [Chloroflexota bacterium]|jgi:ABC-type glycerol-3-phosphate transport system substrate-binding protein